MNGRQLSFLTWKLLGVILLSLSIDPAANLAGSHEINFPSRSATRERGTDQLNSGGQGCSAGNIDASWAIENPPLEIERHTLRVTETGTSDTDFYARNLESSPIQALALVIEYTDEQGGVIERMPVVASTEQANETFHPPFPVERVASLWKVPIAPGESVRVQGVSNGVKATICPSRAIVTFFAVQFVDGTVKKRASPGWQLGPTPRVIPLVSRFPDDVVKPPISVLAHVMISASGQVVEVLSLHGEQVPVLSLIRDQMIRNWKFNPGLFEGRPTASELTVLFRIHSERTLAFPETRPSPSPVTLIEFFPDDKNPGKLLMAYGRLFSGSGVELE